MTASPGSSDSKRAWSLPAQILAVESILERIQPIQFTFPDRDGLVAVLSTLNELRRADGSAAEVRRFSVPGGFPDEPYVDVVLASAYDAVVEANATHVEALQQYQREQEADRKSIAAYASRVAELERDLTAARDQYWQFRQIAERACDSLKLSFSDLAQRANDTEAAILNALHAANSAALSKGAQT